MIYLEQFRGVKLPEYNPFTSINRPVQAPIARMADGRIFDRLGIDQALPGAGVFSYIGNFYDDAPHNTERIYYDFLAERGKAGWLYRRREATGTYERIWARLTDIQHAHTAGFKGLAEQITLTFFAQDPTWNGQRWGNYELAGGRMLLANTDDGYAIPGMPIGATNTTSIDGGSETAIQIYNGGNAPVTGFLIKVAVSGSTALSGIRIRMPQAPVATNSTPAYDFKITTAIGGSGNTPNVTFDTAAKWVKDADGVGMYAAFSYNSVHNRSDWLRLEPGANTVWFTPNTGNFPSGPNTTITIHYADAWQ